MSNRAQCVSYPKSGRSWLRFMLNRLGYGSALRFHHDGFEFNDGARPAHDFDRAARLARYPADAKLIYLTRDPRDVMVSLFHQVTGRFKDFFAYEGDLSAFLRDEYFGAHVLRDFRALWDEILKERQFLRVTYEEMHADPAATLTRVLEYLNLPIEPEAIAAAVREGALENMREVEASGNFSEPWLRPRNGHMKVRRGAVGGFRDDLIAADIAYLNQMFGL